MNKINILQKPDVNTDCNTDSFVVIVYVTFNISSLVFVVHCGNF